MKTKNRYNEHCWIVGNPKIGEGTWIGTFTVIDGSGKLTIGRECEISSGVHIYTHSTALRCVSGKSYKPDGIKNKKAIEKAPVEIGNHTFIGANSTILKGVTIGDHCIIGAGSVVTRDIPSYSVAFGVPAEVVGKVSLKKGSAKIVWNRR
ncbi:MAG: acyltransferase [Candidatus Altiarchaeales archaeon]|nr:acyltransferase [Candidatus Altiarchaeales archaeon]